MAAPLLMNAAALAESVSSKTPRFSALLMSSTREEEPPSVSRNGAGASNIKGLLEGAGTLATWAYGGPLIRGLMVLNSIKDTADKSPSEEAGQEKTLPSQIQAIHRRLLGDVLSVHRHRTADEVADDLHAVAPGTSASAASATPYTQDRFDMQAAVMSAGIVGVGYENAIAPAARESFETAVVHQVKSAAGVIAPGALLSQMTQSQRLAVATAATQASTNLFLQQMKVQNPDLFEKPVPGTRALLESASRNQDAAGIAQQFVVNGSFSEERFSEVAEAPQAMSAAPTGVDMTVVQAKSLIAGMALRKASLALQVVNQVMPEGESTDAPIQSAASPQGRDWMTGMAGRLLRSMRMRQGQERMEMAMRPDEPGNAPNQG